jgi:hypothetical protein
MRQGARFAMPRGECMPQFISTKIFDPDPL